MPAKNVIKNYIEDGYYHVYNRGVEKRTIFMDDSDCKIFLQYIMLYLSPIDEILNKYPDNVRIKKFSKLNLSQEIDLLCFALMPNHFHFLLKQKNKDGIIKFMRRLMTSYVVYFNKKYDRVGSLLQGRYKAVNIDKDEYLLHITRYIHLNPQDLVTKINFNNYSSYDYYLGEKQASWVKPMEILDYFSLKTKNSRYKSYKTFIEDFTIDSNGILDNLILD